MFKRAIFFLFFTLFIILIGNHLFRQIKSWYEIKREVNNMKGEINQLDTTIKDHQEKKDLYQNEEFIRQIAREKLGYTSENEFVFFLPKIPNLAPSNQKEGGGIKNHSYPFFWWQLFFEN